MSHIGQLNRRSGRVLQWIVGGCVALSGVASQVIDTSQGTHANSHLVFAVLLSFGVVCRFRYGLWTREAGLEEIGAFVRQSTRIVYILLYALLAVKLMLNFAAAAGNVTPPEMFRPYLASGLAAILLARALALVSLKPGDAGSNRRDLIERDVAHLVH